MNLVEYQDETIILTRKGKERTFSYAEIDYVLFSLVPTSIGNTLRISFVLQSTEKLEVSLPADDFFRHREKYVASYLDPLKEKKVRVVLNSSLKENPPEIGNPKPTVASIVLLILLEVILVALILLQVFQPFSKEKSLTASDISMIVILGVVFLLVPLFFFLAWRKKKH